MNLKNENLHYMKKRPFKQKNLDSWKFITKWICGVFFEKMSVEKQFLILKFFEGPQIVHRTWLLPNNKVYWSSTLNMSTYYKTVQNGKSPDSSWSIEHYSEKISDSGIRFTILLYAVDWNIFNYIFCALLSRVKTFFYVSIK